MLNGKKIGSLINDFLFYDFFLSSPATSILVYRSITGSCFYCKEFLSQKNENKFYLVMTKKNQPVVIESMKD